MRAKILNTLLITTGIISSSFIISCSSNKDSEVKEPEAKATPVQTPYQRGAYLVTIACCNDCHSPKIFTPMGPVLDSTRLLSGHPEKDPLPEIDPKFLKPGNGAFFSDDLTVAAGPWGVSFPRNLTPDSTTGIGAWSEDMFIKVIRSGKHMGSEAARPILPPMPWYNYAVMPDEDLKAVYAYLKALPPIKNKIPESITPDELLAMKKGK